MRGVPPIGSLSRHERPAWRLAYKLERDMGATEPEARAQAWKALTRARELAGPAGAPGDLGELLAAADRAHGAICVVLKVDANPPTYTIAVTKLEELLVRSWGVKSGPLVNEAVQDLLDISADTTVAGGQKWTIGKKRVVKLQAELAVAGKVFTDQETQGLGRILASAYRLGKAEVAGPIGFQVRFDVGDRNAIHALRDSGVFWIGEHYGEALDSKKLLDTVQETMLEGGLGRAAGGRKLAQAFGSTLVRSETYWRGLAATVATRARSFGAIETMRQAGGRRYEYVNPMDEVTSDVCRSLHGQTFTVAGGVKHRDSLLKASSPEEMKAKSPWPRTTDVLKPEGAKLWKAGGLRNSQGQMDLAAAKTHRRSGAELQAGGVAWPPLHFHCRSKIVIRVWWPLTADDSDPIGNVSPEDLVLPKPGPPKKGKAKAKPVPAVVPSPVLPPVFNPAIPSAVMPNDPGDLSAWRSMFRMNGYTDQEFLDLGELAPHLVPGFPKKAYLIELLEEKNAPGILAWMKAHPPASPKAFPLEGWMPGSSVWQKAVKGDTHDLDGWWIVTQDESDLGNLWWELFDAGGPEGKNAARGLYNWGGAGKGSILDPSAGLSYPEVVEHLARFNAASTGTANQLEGAIVAMAKELELQGFGPFPPPKPIVPLPLKPTPKKPPKAKPPKPVKEAPPVKLEEPLQKPPPEPVADVEDLKLGSAPGGTLEAHPGYDFTPGPIEEAVTLDPATWREYLDLESYDAAEIKALLGTKKSPGLLRELLTEIEAEGKALALPDADVLAWAKVRVPGVLANHPPRAIVTQTSKPPAFVSPSELGSRLVKSGETNTFDSALGEAWRDQVDGTTYWLRAYDDEGQARAEVVATALYRRLGLEVPEVRLVHVDGRLHAATKRIHGWEKSGAIEDAVKTHGQELGRSMPADAWMGNWNVTGTDSVKLVTRKAPIPGLEGVNGGVMRSDNRGVFGFRWTGTQKPTGAWSAGEVPEIQTLLDTDMAPNAAKAFKRADDDRSLLLPMMDRIGAITEEEIAAAVRLGGMAENEAAELQGILLGRARVIKAEATKQRKAIAAEAVERREAQRLAVIRAEQAKERRKDLQERLERGELVPGMVIPGPTLEQIAPLTELEGAVAVQGDHGLVRDQMIRIRRYSAENGRGIVQHEGFEIHAVIDSTAFRGVEAGLDKLGRESVGPIGIGTGRRFRSHERVRLHFAEGDTAGSSVFRLNVDTETDLLGAGRFLETADASIDFAGDGSLMAMRGQLRIRIKASDPKGAQKKLDQTLRDLGLEAMLEPPTGESVALMQGNKALWSLQGGGYKASAEGAVLDLAEIRKALKRHKVKLEDLEQVAIGTRGYHATEIPGRWKGYQKDHGLRFLYHEAKVRKDPVRGMTGADGGPGGIMATTERWNNGTPTRGASSTTDLDTGGGSSVFTRLVSEENLANGQSRWGSYGDTGFIIHPRTLDRTDWYANEFDNYGRLRPGRPGANTQVKTLAGRSSGNDQELMIRYEVPPQDLLLMKASSERVREKILAWLREDGVTTRHGMPIEEWVVVMTRPSDYSHFNPKNPVHAFVSGKADDIPEGILDASFAP